MTWVEGWFLFLAIAALIILVIPSDKVGVR